MMVFKEALLCVEKMQHEEPSDRRSASHGKLVLIVQLGIGA